MTKTQWFNDEGMAAAAEARVASLPVRAAQVLVVAAVSIVVLASAVAPVIWLVCMSTGMAVDYACARAYLRAGRRDRQAAKTRFILSVSATVAIFAQMALLAALTGGEAGRMIAMMMAAGSLFSVMTYLHRAQAFVMLTAVPPTLVMLATPLLPAGTAAASPLQATIGVVLATAGFLGYLARASLTNARLFGEVVEARRMAERARVQAEMRSAEAEAANRVKTRFVDTMSHELRTPLNAVIGYAEILQEDLEEEGRNQSARDALKIQAAARNLLGMIDQVLDLSKVESGLMAVDIAERDVQSLLREAVDSATPMAEMGGNSIDLFVAPDVGVIATDIAKLRRCVLNLLTNACKFTSNGRIAIGAALDGDSLVISVSDTGIGICEDAMPNLFQPFRQGDGSLTRAHGGAGLGLAVTRKLIEVLGGEVSAVSTEGKGSVFRLRLPMRPGARNDLTNAEYADVLIVDDDPAACDLLARAAERVGLVSRSTGTLVDGWAAAQAAPGLIVLDIALPDGEGWMLLEQLRETPALAHTPVIVMTVSDDRARAMRLGASFFLRKPVDRDELCATLVRFARPRDTAAAPTPPKASSSEAAA